MPVKAEMITNRPVRIILLMRLIILLSSVVGALVGIGLILFKQHDREKPIPFGPYLAVAGWIALIWGHGLVTAYYHWAVTP